MAVPARPESPQQRNDLPSGPAGQEARTHPDPLPAWAATLLTLALAALALVGTYYYWRYRYLPG